MKRTSFRRSGSGFTLLEVMIACAVVAILAAIAFPSYRNHVIRTYRIQAQTCMMDQANVLERHFTMRLSYVGAPRAACAVELKGYALEVQDGDHDYAITAIPNSVNGDQRCGTLSLDQAGRRRPEQSDCW